MRVPGLRRRIRPFANECSSRDDGGVLSVHEIESLRRSHAMAPLSASHVSELLESCASLARERQAIVGVLVGLPESFSEVRRALNDLQRILGS